MKVRRIVITLFLALLFVSATAHADVMPGVRAGVYTDAESAFVGGEVLWGVARDWYLDPNIEYVFVDPGNLVTFNFDVHYDFHIDAPVYIWAGGGLAVIHSSIDIGRRDVDETNLGVNLIAGVGFNKGGSIIPYIQPKAIIADNSEFSVAFGLRF
jgi:hypothetical protein